MQNNSLVRNKFFLVVVVILSVLILLFDPYAEAKSPVAFGAKSGDRDALLVHDFNSFSLLQEDMFTLNRYGFGRGQMEVSDRIQLSAENRSGILIDGERTGPKVGIELVNGKVFHKGDLGFQWEPGLSAGYKVNLGVLGIYTALRAGTSMEKDRKADFIGSAIHLQLLGLSGNYFYNRYFKNEDTLKIIDINLGNMYNIQMQEDSRIERVYMIGIKL